MSKAKLWCPETVRAQQRGKELFHAQFQSCSGRATRTKISNDCIMIHVVSAILE